MGIQNSAAGRFLTAVMAVGTTLPAVSQTMEPVWTSVGGGQSFGLVWHPTPSRPAFVKVQDRSQGDGVETSIEMNHGRARIEMNHGGVSIKVKNGGECFSDGVSAGVIAKHSQPARQALMDDVVMASYTLLRDASTHVASAVKHDALQALETQAAKVITETQGCTTVPDGLRPGQTQTLQEKLPKGKVSAEPGVTP